MNIPLRLLIIDDNPEDRVQVMRALHRKFPRLVMEQISDARGFAQALERGDFDLVIMEHRLFWADGLTVVHAVKARYPDCPVVMFTTADSEEIAVTAMKAGLDDYVFKTSPPLAHLASAVKAALERVRQGRALRAVEARYRQLVENVPVGLYRFTPEGKILEVNPALVQIYGYPDKESLLRVNAVDLYLNPEERRRWLSLLGTEGVVRDFETQMRRRDGAIIWVRNSARVIRDDIDKVLYLEGSMVDITARKRAEELFRDITNSSLTGICIHQDGKFQFINPKFQEYIGASEDETLGSEATRFILPEDRKMARENAIKMLKGERMSPYEYRVVVKSGEVRWVLETVAPIKFRGRRAVLGNFMDITEHRRTEELFRDITASSLSGICIHQDGKFQFINPKFQEYIGASEDETLGSEATRFILPEDRKMARENAIKMLKGEWMSPYEYRVVAKSGEVRWVLETVAPVKFRGRQAVLGNFMDITEHKRMEELFRDIISNSLTGISIVQDGKFQLVNPKVPQYLGYSEDEVVGTNIFRFILPEDREMVRENAIKMLKGERVSPYEYRVVAKRGEVHWILEAVSSIKYLGRRAVLANFMDITERKRAEEALQRSEVYFRLLSKNSSDVIMILDREGTICCISPAVERMLGYRPEELVGKKAFEFVHPDDAANVAQAFAQAVQVPGYTTSMEVRARHKDGSWRIIEGVGTNLLDNPAVAGVVVNWRDITERKRTEEIIQRLALLDSLTGLPNRRLFDDRLGVALAQAGRRQERLAVLRLALDKFKDINEQLGHSVADQLLPAVSQRLTSLLHKGDTVSRLGEDEFALLLTGLSQEEEVERIAAKIQEALRQPFVLGGGELHITTSIGIALYPGDGEEGETLMRNAGIAMYRARAPGGNKYPL